MKAEPYYGVAGFAVKLRRPVWVEMVDGKVVRIFRNAKDPRAIAALSDGTLGLGERAKAVRDIRQAVFARDSYACTHCGKVVTWETGQLHERVWRGRGGEVSLDNCTTLCAACHKKDPVAGHGNRVVQWSK